MPCEAVSGKPRYFLGSAFQHGITPILVDKYINVTTVPNPTGPGTVPPYERWQDNSLFKDCSRNNCRQDSGGPPCGPWQPPFTPNQFQKNGQVNFAVTRKRGFKAVHGRKFWQGVFPFTEKETNQGVDTILGCGAISSPAPAVIKYRSAQVAQFGKGPVRTRYLQTSISSEYKNTVWSYSGGVGTSAITDDILEFTQGIDQNSGLPSIAIQSSVGSKSGAITDIYFWNWDEIVNRMTSPVSGGGNVVYNDGSATVTDPDTGAVLEQLNWDLAGGTFSRIVYYYPNGYINPPLTGSTENASVGDSSFNYERSDFTYNSDKTISIQTDVTITASLSTPYADSCVYNAVCGNGGLLSLWNLADDEKLPWRTDGRLSVAPLVCRDEILSQNWMDTFWAKNFASPIPADSSGNPLVNMPGPFWDGQCDIIAAPDPRTGTAIGVIELPGIFSGVEISGVFSTPFAQGTCTGMVIIGGKLPNGVNGAFDPVAQEFTYSGTPDGSDFVDGQPQAYFGVTLLCTCSVPAVTGNILGAPQPVGYQNYFDFGFTDWRACCNDIDGDITFHWYLLGFGMFLDDFNGASGSQIPETATHWTNWFQAVNKPHGAWLFYNDQGNYFPGSCPTSNQNQSGAGDANALWACKYAEILDLWPSQNFARPAGNDKFSYDENQVVCATNQSGAGVGSTWNITDLLGNVPADTTDFSGIWGGRSVGGFFNVQHYAGGTLTLGAKVYNLPSNWKSLSGDDATCFGKLRFPNCPALLGRVAVTKDPNDQSGLTLEYVGPYQPQFGMNPAAQETVDIWDADMNLLAGGVMATRQDDYSFKTAAAYPDAAYITITGAAKYYFNDTDPKGDYALLEWISDFRTPAEYQRVAGVTDCNGNPVGPLPGANLGGGPAVNPYAFFSHTPGCIPFVPCGPKIVCITPNGEQFSNGVTYLFPQAGYAANQFYFDQTYGSKWWASPQSAMTDLLWQTPHRPCTIPASWQPDDGSCPQDGQHYASAPQVECRLTVPCNYGQGQNECAPALPAGIQIGWLSPVNYNAGDVAYPPTPVVNADGSPGENITAFILHALICNEIAGNCQFNYVLPGC